MALSIDDIVKKDFSHAFMGYDMQEVDVFLDTIIEQVEKMEHERAELMETMERLLKRVEVLERTNAREKAALKESKAAAKKELPEAETPIAAAAANVEEKPKPERREAEKVRSVKHTTHAPLRPVRPAGVSNAVDKAQPQMQQAETAPLNTAPFAVSAETPAFQQQPAVPVQEEVAVEVETGAFAPDPSTLIPDLVSGVEDALLERSVIRAASYEADAERTRT